MFGRGNAVLLTISMIGNEAACLLEGILGTNERRNKAISGPLHDAPSGVSFWARVTTSSGLTVEIAQRFSNVNDSIEMQARVGSEIVNFSFNSVDLSLCLDAFSKKIIAPAIRRFPCAIAARQRAFKLRKYQARSRVIAAGLKKGAMLFRSPVRIASGHV